MFSRSYYHARDAALVIVFAINLILLFYKVSRANFCDSIHVRILCNFRQFQNMKGMKH